MITEKEKWNNAVRSLQNYDVFYLQEYAKAYKMEDEANGEPLLLVYSDENDYAVNVIFYRDIANLPMFCDILEHDQYYDICSPYGYGGFIGEISDYDKLNQEYLEFQKKKGYICEFVRFNLFSEYFNYYDGQVVSPTHNVVRDLSLTQDELWMDFKQKVRKNVKHALRNELRVILDETGEYLDDFLRIYYGTMERTNANDNFFYSRHFFELLNEMQGNYVYFHVLHNDVIISTELVLYGKEQCYSYLGGTDSNYFNLRPNDLLKYEIIKWAKDKGLNNFVLGGGYGSDDGIFQYKTCLAPNGIVKFYVGRKIIEKEKYEWLVNQRQSICEKPINENYFPLYRS